MSTVAEAPISSLSKRAEPPALPESAPPAERLFAAPQQFDFFQAVRLLEQLEPTRRQVGANASPGEEIVRFSAAMGTAFPASSIADLTAATDTQEQLPPAMTISFLGLTGPSGALPAHYSELLWRLQRDVRSREKNAVRAWFDLFNHRLTSLFYRAWEKYRPLIPYERGEYRAASPDTFTQGVLSFAGLSAGPNTGGNQSLPAAYRLPRALVRYAGLLAQRPRNVTNLRTILCDFFALPVEIIQFQGEWVPLASDQQMQLGVCGTLGSDATVGPRVWNRQGKIRLKVGPLNLKAFEELLPCQPDIDDGAPHLGELAAATRFYLGPEIDFDVQLVLSGDGVPQSQLGGSDSTRLGWNSWLPGGEQQHRADAVFGFAN